MTFTNDDLLFLQQGLPPRSSEALNSMTIGKEHWHEYNKAHYLQNLIPSGFSKVKIIVGEEGTGKTHLLSVLAEDAKECGFTTAYILARDNLASLKNIVEFYKAVAACLNLEELVRRLCCRVALECGVEPDSYDGTSTLIPYLTGERGMLDAVASRHIIENASKFLKSYQLSTAFTLFALQIVRSRMIDYNRPSESLALNWLLGNKLTPDERKALHIHERLMKANARHWLNSLSKIVTLAGYQGLVIAVDNLEIITERDPSTGKFICTTNAVKDISELIRQLIDECEVLNNLYFFFSGRPLIISDEKRGIFSYEALRLRMQSGLILKNIFNRHSDILSLDDLVNNNSELYSKEVSERLAAFLLAQFQRSGKQVIKSESNNHPRAAVQAVALCYEPKAD